MKRMTVLCALIAVLGLGCSDSTEPDPPPTTTTSSAPPASITYDSRAEFVSATGGRLVGAIPMRASGVEFTIGSLAFVNEPPSSVNTTRNWSTLIGESFDLAINGIESFNINSSAALFAIGFDVHEPSDPSPGFPNTCGGTCTDSTFRVTLLNGSTIVAVHDFSPPNDTLAFIGIWTRDPFNRIEVRETTGTGDNEFFGNFTTGLNGIT